MHLKNPTEMVTSRSTVCFRFFHYQVPMVNNSHHQVLLKLGKLMIVSSWSHKYKLIQEVDWWQNDDLITGAWLYKKLSNMKGNIKLYEFPEWNFRSWNSFCLYIDVIAMNLKIIINDKPYLNIEQKKDKIFDEYGLSESGRSILKSISLMGLRVSDAEDRYVASVFGKITDLTI